MKAASIFTIPKTVTGREELVVVPRKVFEKLLARQVSSSDILGWSQEAKQMKKEGKLLLLRSLKDLR